MGLPGIGNGETATDARLFFYYPHMDVRALARDSDQISWLSVYGISARKRERLTAVAS
jgi:hypothetical protein